MSELKEKPPFIPSLTEGDFSAVTVKEERIEKLKKIAEKRLNQTKN